MNDPRDCPVGTASRQALECSEHALWHLVSFFGDPLAALDATLAADPGWGLARLMKADFIFTLTEPAMLAQARAEVDAARPLMAHANDRERTHFTASELCLAGRWREASEVWDELLRRHPRDLLALLCAHLFDFYRGDARALRARVARVLPEWPQDDPLQPYVLGMYAFGLEECNLYAQAEAVGRRALSGPAQVPWAVHAVAHVMEMQGRHAEGAAWLQDQTAGWALDNGLSGHNWWHLALFRLETLDTAAALKLHDDHLAGAKASVNLQWLDAASLLWRLQLLGVDVGARWQTLAQAWADPVGHAGHYAFNDLHALLALLGSGDVALAQALLAAVRARSSDAQHHGADNRAMALEVGLPLMQGLLAQTTGKPHECIAALWPVRAVAHRFGGSHAQRDLIDQSLLAAAAQAGDQALACSLLNERRCAKPATPLTQYWAQRTGLQSN